MANTFYMVIQDKTIIDVLTNISYVRTQVVHNRLMVCSKEYAEGILSSDNNTIWYVSDLIEENTKDYPTVTLIEIDEDRYNTLKDILDLNETVEYEEPQESGTDDEPSEDEVITIEFVREAKITEMSNACNNKIISGFDIVLSDGKPHHFDFTLEEQANFMFLKSSIDAGQTSIPYHAKNEPCRFFSPEEILQIIEMGVSIKTYETTYFNSLKQYILSLEQIEEIRAVYYGMSIPKEYYSEVMMVLSNTSGTGSETDTVE